MSYTQAHRRFGAVVVFSLFTGILFALGCSETRKASVSGTVKVGGTPLAQGSLTFFVSKTRQGGAAILNGAYSMPDAPVGEVIVLVEVDNPVQTMSMMGGKANQDKITAPPGIGGMPADMVPQRKTPPPPAEQPATKGPAGKRKGSLVNEKYKSAATSDKKVTVKPGTQTIDIDLDL